MTITEFCEQKIGQVFTARDADTLAGLERDLNVAAIKFAERCQTAAVEQERRQTAKRLDAIASRMMEALKQTEG